MSEPNGPTYDASNIKVLPGIEGVRMRPAMYIGDTASRGLQHLVEEVVANSIDEAMGGYCTEIQVQVNADGSVTVTDNGRGIPVDMHPTEGKSALDVIMTTLHAGGKFDRATYKVSGGLHGVGVSVVNALSEWCTVEVRREGSVYHQRYERGITASEVEVIGKSKTTGTTTTFRPDGQIFPEIDFNFDTIVSRARELAFLNRGVHLVVKDERTDKERDFCYEGGISAFVEHLNEGKAALHAAVIYFEKAENDVHVEVAMQYNSTFSENVFSFVNNISTIEGGTHLYGFRSALTRTVNAYAKAENLLKGDRTPEGEDVREGLTAIISVKIPEPQFEGQTKTKLGNREVQGIVESIVNERLGTYLEENPKEAKTIVQKATMAAEARESARKARDLTRRKSALSSGNLPTKLADCSSRDVETTELFIVEGQSAGGNAKQCRDARFQAILPIQGKILNVEKARINKMLSHDEIQTLILAIGTGIGLEEFDLSKRRYGKIIIMTDADVDGAHIRTLLLTFFFRHMAELIRGGHIYLAQPPLYRVRRKKVEQYFLTDEDFRNALIELGGDGTALEVLATGTRLEGDELHPVVGLLRAIEGQSRTLGKHGIALAEFLQNRRPDDGCLPRYRIAHNGDHFFAHTEAEFREITQRIADDLANGETQAVGADLDESVRHTEIHESHDIEKTISELEARGFSMDDFFVPEEDDPPAKFRLHYEGESHELACIAQIAPGIRHIGERGITIQRYKGLGEMNPGQLGETTMDPKTRTLLRVRLDDAVEADRLFSLLMGSNVVPRRQFIEEHALEATNLDV